ncbi:MAG: ATP-binding cassette domain-containing protein, partial [Bacteroidota bacterium]
MHAIQVESLTCLYRNGRGIRNIDLEVRQGEVFGFLGPNGAGKTTTLRMILDLARPTAGSVTILGSRYR